jgi:hypothetical protein
VNVPPYLTQEEVNGLDEGAMVRVVWSGGNGPHLYKIVKGECGESYVDNVYRDPLRPVGLAPLTTVRLVEGT